MSSIPGSVGYISMFIKPTITWVPSGLSGYIWLDTKIVFKKEIFSLQFILNEEEIVFFSYFLQILKAFDTRNRSSSIMT